jgi:hypothetical protein
MLQHMSRVTIASTSFLLAACFGYVVACTNSNSSGAPCESDADCGEGLICDVHDGLGTCQEDHSHDTHADTHATGTDTGTDTEAEGCAAETRDDEFAIGLSKSGQLVTATFVSADPALPIKGDNTWVLSITDLGGAPLDGLTIQVTPMMPDHGHGTAVVAEVMATGNPGEYTLTPVNLFMAGYWEVTLDVTSDAGQDSVMFGVCVE